MQISLLWSIKNILIYKIDAVESAQADPSIIYLFGRIKTQFTELIRNKSSLIVELKRRPKNKPKTKTKKVSFLFYSKSSIFTRKNLTIYETLASFSVGKYPFNIILNISTSSCWLISFIHNLRSNPELLTFVINNCKDRHLPNLIEKLLNIRGSNIPSRIIEEVNRFMNYSIFKRGGNDIQLLEKILNALDLEKIKENYPEYKNESIIKTDGTGIVAIMLETVSSMNENYALKSKQQILLDKIPYKIMMKENLQSFPYLIISCKKVLSEKAYINVGNAILGLPNDSKNPIKVNYCTNIFAYCPKFLIIRLKTAECKDIDKPHIKGLIIQKAVYIKINTTNKLQKYKLTGMTMIDMRSIPHLKSIIMIKNRWYDADCETIKYIKARCSEKNLNYEKLYDNLHYLEKEESIVKYLNFKTKEEIVFDYLENLKKSINLLFYQIEESNIPTIIT